jgi:hypothetical protein
VALKNKVLNANKAYTMCTPPYTKWGEKNFNFLLITNPVAPILTNISILISQICILQAKGERRAMAQSPTSTSQFQHKKGRREMMQKRIGLGFNHWFWFYKSMASP